MASLPSFSTRTDGSGSDWSLLCDLCLPRSESLFLRYFFLSLRPENVFPPVPFLIYENQIKSVVGRFPPQGRQSITAPAPLLIRNRPRRFLPLSLLFPCVSVSEPCSPTTFRFPHENPNKRSSGGYFSALTAHNR